MSLVLLFAAAVATLQAPPPIVRTTPPAPPPPPQVIMAPPPVITTGWTSRPTVTVRVRVIGGREVLLADRFRVGRAGANYSMNRTEAAPAECPQSFGDRGRSSLNFGLGAGYSDREPLYRLSVSWARASDAACAAGQRTVGLEQQVTLVPGRTVVVEGDGGLRVELTAE